MNVGIVGLGLIGGSMAKAYKKAGARVSGFDSNKVIEDFAKMSGAIDDELDETHFSSCRLIILAVTPPEAMAWLKENAGKIGADTIVVDCCGTKRMICEEGFAIAKASGFTFVGGHPMAGKQVGGFKNSRADLFAGATMALVPDKCDDPQMMSELKALFEMAGFSKIVITTAEEHDEIIAFTSQMTHLAANAFIKSQTALQAGGAVSAGSFRDFTRVANLDEDMWTELFFENRDNLINELAQFIAELQKYEKALEEGDRDTMKELLSEGARQKSEVEKRCG